MLSSRVNGGGRGQKGRSLIPLKSIERSSQFEYWLDIRAPKLALVSPYTRRLRQRHRPSMGTLLIVAISPLNNKLKNWIRRPDPPKTTELI